MLASIEVNRSDPTVWGFVKGGLRRLLTWRRRERIRATHAAVSPL